MNPIRPVGSSALRQSQQTGGGAKPGQDFGKLISDTLEQELQQKSVLMTSPDAAGGNTQALSGDSGLMQLLLTSAATGKVGQEDVALFLLSAMMEHEAQGKEFAPLMGAMGAMLSQRGASGIPVAPQRAGQNAPQVSGAVARRSGEAVPADAWKPCNVALTGKAGERNPRLLSAVIDQFDVEGAARYKPYRRGRDTYCNIFVWDVTSALSCEIPHYVDRATGRARSFPDVRGAVELDANGVCGWLAEHGAANGWREVSAQEAQAYANSGHPAVTAWNNPKGTGHVQMVRPSSSGGYDAARGVTVAQSGGRNLNYAHISSTMRLDSLKAVRYYVHD